MPKSESKKFSILCTFKSVQRLLSICAWNSKRMLSNVFVLYSFFAKIHQFCAKIAKKVKLPSAFVPSLDTFARKLSENKYFWGNFRKTKYFAQLFARTNIFAKICQNLMSSKYFHKNGISVSHVTRQVMLLY